MRRGNKYIVNGCKKWITNGIWADYCTAAVRTGGAGAGGISMLVVPLKVNGVTCTKLENSGVAASGRLIICPTLMSKKLTAVLIIRIYIH